MAGTTQGINKKITIPQNTEVYVIINANQSMAAHFIAGMDNGWYNTGYYADPGYYGMSQIHKMSDTEYALAGSYFVGTDVGASSTCIWYYR